ncbi:glycosyltransferase family 4 protein [Phreatobacter sp.]|uniref:glycosyltransferase family 4 protein n=1 Tax=Phreatobacter sp. TaxID=1966341 RepID=UPI003F70475A
MTKTILFEGRNLTLTKGTGIATYARNLTGIARDLGYGTELLVSTDQPLPRSATMSEVALFDAHKKTQSPAMAALRSYFRGLVPVPFGIRTTSVTGSGIVVTGRGGNLLEEFNRLHLAYDLFEVANQHLIRFGKLAKVNVGTRPDLFHATHPTPLKIEGAANIYTVHDLIPLRLPYATLDKKELFFDTMKALAREADHIVTVSEFSRQEIVSLLDVPESRVTNTYQAVSLPEDLTSRPMEEVEDELANVFNLEPSGYFLFFGALEPKKNVGNLIDAYIASGSKRPLVIAGGLGWQYEDVLEKIADPRFVSYRIDGNVIRQENRVRRVSHLPLGQLVSLIRGARAVLFPSLYEGFGLPVLEAMLLGTPVMTSNVSSLPEIAGDAAVLVDPYNVTDMGRSIRQLDRDDDLVRELSARGPLRAAAFSPEHYRARLETLYRSLLG